MSEPVIHQIPEPPPRRLPDAHFGRVFLSRVLHRDRVMESIDRVLGETIELGPIGAGPGRMLAKVSARGTFGKTYGHELEGEIGYQVHLPISVTFDLDLRIDQLSFDADVVVPLQLRMYVEEPLTIIWDITPPEPEALTISVKTDKRRSAMLQRMAGMDDELRRFIVRFVARELEKPHVRRATRIDLVSVIDGAWQHIAGQFLPPGPEERG